MSGAYDKQIFETLTTINHSVAMIAHALVAQTKMLATVYNLDAEGRPVAPVDPDQGEFPLSSSAEL